jgi:pyruvate dehydrogenase E1 component alpha subunit
LPVVFLVINNEYAMGTSVERASAEPELHRRADAFRMHGERVDGDEFEAVAESAGRLLRRAREERKPAVLEAMTYRYRGHSVADAGLSYRTRDEINAWRQKDPIALLRQRVLEQGVSEDELAELERDVDERVEAAVAYATADEPPAIEELAAGMYAPGSGEQFERMRPGSPFGELELIFDARLGR